ncbi:MAG: TIGR01212 family radical SAM protein, partial [Calditerrivibrio sp.]|nr:TIGR01212 family radical SAM protein [Calditerrivibrio sp.]
MRYFTLNRYLKQKFGEKVSKVAVDVGLTCPNRDGLKGWGGCIYCDNSSFVFVNGLTIEEQISNRIKKLSEKGIHKYLLYFQSYSNTYCSDEQFYKMISSSLIDDRIVGIHIGTRPDVVSDEKLKFLSDLNDKYEIFMEYGLQSSHNKTLELINRGHSYEEFVDTVYRTKSYGLKITVHLILGLPGEDYGMMMETVQKISRLPIDSVKFHHLHILKNTKIEKLFIDGAFELISEDEYIKTLADSLTLLKEDVIISRLVGDAPEELLIAPDWPISKH